MQIFIAGDSTAATYTAKQAPTAGWGQMFGQFVREQATVHNKARGGRSSKSFIDEGRLQEIEEGLQPGDYLLIQFGHNDQKQEEVRYTEPATTYKQYLRRYIDAAVAKQAQPVLLTSVARRHFNGEGVLVPSHGNYPQAMRELAAECGIPLLDMERRTEAAYRHMGPDASISWFVWLKPGEHENYPEGKQDNTHFNESGAWHVAEMVAEEVRRSGIELAAWLKPV